MSKYNKYAKMLDTEFKKARTNYITAYEELKKAKNNYSDNAGYRAGEQEYYWRARKAEAELKLAKAEECFNIAKNEGWTAFKNIVANIRAELKAELDANSLANPDELDNNAVELLKIGALSIDDMEHLVDKYDTNPTMLKLINKYAEDMAKNASSALDRQRLNDIAHDTATGLSRKLIEFDAIADAAMVYAGLTRKDNTPDFIASISSSWELEAAGYIENF